MLRTDESLSPAGIVSQCALTYDATRAPVLSAAYTSAGAALSPLARDTDQGLIMKLYQLELRLMNRLVQLSGLNKQLWSRKQPLLALQIVGAT